LWFANRPKPVLRNLCGGAGSGRDRDHREGSMLPKGEFGTGSAKDGPSQLESILWALPLTRT